MRCKSCDRIMSETEMRAFQPDGVTYEDMCNNCLKYVYEDEDEESVTEIHEYVHQHAKEGLKSDYFSDY